MTKTSQRTNVPASVSALLSGSAGDLAVSLTMLTDAVADLHAAPAPCRPSGLKT